MDKGSAHTDNEIKDWVCTHIGQLLQTDRHTQEKEFKAQIKIPDAAGGLHHYTVFMELTEIDGHTEWVVRNIIRPEQLQ